MESLNENEIAKKAVSLNEFAEIHAHTTHASGGQALDCITHSGSSHKLRSIPSATQQWCFPTGKLFRQESKSFSFLPHLRSMNTCIMRAMPVANIHFRAAKVAPMENQRRKYDYYWVLYGKCVVQIMNSLFVVE